MGVMNLDRSGPRGDGSRNMPLDNSRNLDLGSDLTCDSACGLPRNPEFQQRGCTFLDFQSAAAET